MAPRLNGVERRSFGRRRSCIHAMLLVPGRPPSPCIVRNYSPVGALLELNEKLDPPFNLKLRFDRTGEVLACELKHARGDRIGVILRGDDIVGVIERALGGKTKLRKQTARLMEPIPRVSGQDLRRQFIDRRPA